MTDLRYPVGRFQWPEKINEEDRRRCLREVEEAPAKLREAVQSLSDAQLETPYRDGGWTVRQVVHHLADSHMNAYIRFKLALTEDEPTIKPYEQERWAELPDGKTGQVEVSLALLETLHRRWAALLRAMKPADFARKFRHPELGEVTLERNLALYAWHSRHHVAHITSLRKRMGWDGAR